MVPILVTGPKVPLPTSFIWLSLKYNLIRKRIPRKVFESSFLILLWLRLSTFSSEFLANVPLQTKIFVDWLSDQRVFIVYSYLFRIGNKAPLVHGKHWQTVYLFKSEMALWDKLHQPIFVKSAKWDPSSLLIWLWDRSRYSVSLKPLNWFLFSSLISLSWRSNFFSFFRGANASTGKEVRVPTTVK